MASAGPYASLHLAPDRQPRQHPPLSVLQAGCGMPFLPPNWQRQSTEAYHMLIKVMSLPFIKFGEITDLEVDKFIPGRHAHCAVFRLLRGWSDLLLLLLAGVQCRCLRTLRLARSLSVKRRSRSTSSHTQALANIKSLLKVSWCHFMVDS